MNQELENLERKGTWDARGKLSKKSVRTSFGPK